MQTNLPIQLNTTGSAGQRNAVNGGANASDGGQFGAMLSNEMERNAPAPAPAKPQQASKPQEAAKPAQPDDAKPADSQAGAADAANHAQQADDAGKADAADQADAQGEEAADGSAAPTDPASAMLALMASLQKPADEAATGKAAATTDAPSQAWDALNGARGKRSDAGQLAALQAALKSTAKETGADGGKTFAATGTPKNPALAAAGAALGADDKAGAGAAVTGAGTGKDGPIDLRALQGVAKAEGQAQPEVEFTLQQARDAALLAAQKEAAPAAAALAPAQPASLAAVQAAAAASEQLTARVGTTAWENQVGQKVVYMVGSEEQTASLTLNPPDLGPLQVVLSVSNDQTNVTFSSNELEVRQALQDALPRLREMMDQSGIALGNATVNAGMPDGSQARDQAARNDGGFGRRNGSGRGNNGRDDGAIVGETTVRPARAVAGGARGAVDTFA
ncbi:flagellar hook-length control protein FliK [Massilia sp. YIM B02763]|uniref:flagellar hook-length control protein FliK n=1 Tax=Massilia sp. YIM B02763 TaxID=3050130 RepID=UPI0025B6568A|nr:flagellar hook-length control protein FliK [Massilia sp. YIM B02763]MDN4052646.1 flagellar hook-length control protein FliK [Massilia sp. YIM B02763]